MKLHDYVKSKVVYIITFILAIISIAAVLNVHSIPKYSIFFISVILTVSFLIPFLTEFFIKRSFYNNLTENVENLDKKFLLSEIIECPDFFEGKMFYDVLKRANKSMNDEIAKYRINTNDYKEYIEKWVHEIKTPIAACKLAVENRSENSWNELAEDLDRIDLYVDQTLFYSRINNAEKDYIIKPKTLSEIVSYALKSNARSLIKNGFSIQRENLDITVMTDEKWTAFILDQIISNSIKYKTQKPNITFKGVKNENGVSLQITDNGIGIASCDLPRIFEKNFTGGNGRLNRKATGFGLYLCKKLCSKMGIEISAYSENGTTITIFFPKSTYTSI